MDIFLGLIWLYAVVYATSHAWQHAKQARRKSRGEHVTKSAPATPSARRHAVRQHDIAWWAREASQGFPVHRTGLHSGWLAHRTALDQHKAKREEIRTSHLEGRASVLSEMRDHRKRQADAQERIDKALAAAGQEAGGKQAASAADCRVHGDEAPPLPADSVRAPDDGAAHLKAPMPDPRLNDAQRQRDQNGQRNICAACGHPGTPGDPLIIRDGFRVHESHATDPASGFYGGQKAAPGTAPSPPTANGAPAMPQTAEMNYTAAIETSKKIETEAEEVAASAAQSPAGDMLDSLTGMGLDAGTLSDFAEVDDAHREYVKAAERYGEAATSARENLERSHGGIQEAVSDSPVDAPAQPEFYAE